MSQDQHTDIFSEHRNKVNERLSIKLQRRVRTGRSVLFLMAVLSAVAFIATTYTGLGDKISLAFAVIYLILFFFSAKQPRVFLLIAAFVGSGLWLFNLLTVTTNTQAEMLRQMVFLIYFISMTIKAILITFLIRGGLAAKKWEELNRDELY